jgi:hypothetical protein
MVRAGRKPELETSNFGIYDEWEVLSCWEFRWSESTGTLVTSRDSEFHNKIPKIIILAVLPFYNLGSYS